MDYELGKPEWIGTARAFVMGLGGEMTEEVLQLLAPNVIYRVLGHHALSGVFSGRDEVAGHLKALITQTDGRIDPVKFEDWMLGLSHVSILVDLHAEVGGAGQLLRHLMLMHFNAEDLVDDVTVFFSDPDVAERLYGTYLRDGSMRRDG